MTTCKDCIYFEACYQLNSELKKYPKDYLESDICAKQCTTFKDRSDYMDSKQVLDYVAKVRSRIITSSALDCELYSYLNVFGDVFKRFKIPPADVKGDPHGN